MASEDVIELGSSDDEAQPAPKKKKPMPNAMVHIPTKLPGLTIKPAKFNLIPAPRINPTRGYHASKGILSKPIMISRNNLNFDCNVNKNKTQAQHIPPVRVPIMKHYPKITRPVISAQNRSFINPISVARNLKKPELVIKKVAPNKKPKNAAGIQGPKLLNNLPPGITIKPLAHAGVSGFNKNRNANNLKNTIGEVLTVEIDDEEAAETPTDSPQWYLRPEEQEDNKLPKDSTEEINKPHDNEEMSFEEQNNKEPNATNFVEITIEDSPVKVLQLRERSEIGKELAITIEDSPVKLIENKEVDSEGESVMDRLPQSKKKLDYPKGNVNDDMRQVVEIEIDLIETPIFNDNDKETKSNEQNKKIPCNQEQLKPDDKEDNISKKGVQNINDSKDSLSNSGEGEFHKVYQAFIDMCFKLENSEDMKKIVEKKIKAYYKQCPKEYVESEEFIDIVSSKIVAMRAAPEKMYLYIKDIVDELNLQRKMNKTVAPTTRDVVDDKINDGEENELDSKKHRQVRKLEKTIKKLHRAIQKLEEQEVDFEDDEDSVYLLTERYKERMVRVHAKFCQLTNTKMPSEPRICLEVRPGRPAGPVRKLEKWINRKVPIGTPLPFPDFHDVKRCVKEANEEDSLGWNEVDIMEEARDLFTRCGKKLQRRRQENEWRLAISRISHDVDPALENIDLKKKLDENQSLASKKEAEVLNKYADRQNQMKLVAEEIGDKEADESPVESEEEEHVEDNNLLVNKQKRKERLKRLLQEKNRKTEEKENNPTTEENSNIKSNEYPVESKQVESDTQIQDNNLNKTDVAAVDAQDTEVNDAIDNINENIITKDIEDKNIYREVNDIDSDIDELHLLQKLHSDNESDASTLDSSGSDTPISISDTLDSDSETENKKPLSDVISIENSSYSESEVTADDGFSIKYDVKTSNIENFVSSSFEVEYFSKRPLRNESENIIENILLASSDDETNENEIYNATCINLKDDDISITETTIEGAGEAVVTKLLRNKEGLNILETVDGNENTDTLIDKFNNPDIQGNNKLMDTIMECNIDEADIHDTSKDENKSISDDVSSVEILDAQNDHNKDESISIESESQ